MAKKSKFGSMKRFGPRYGRRNKEKVAALEQEYRFKHVCPYCNYEKLKRLAAGIWTCEKCGVKFAGKAYMTPQKQKIKLEDKKDISESFEGFEKELEEQRITREEQKIAREELKKAEEVAEGSEGSENDKSNDRAVVEETDVEPVEEEISEETKEVAA